MCKVIHYSCWFWEHFTCQILVREMIHISKPFYCSTCTKRMVLHTLTRTNTNLLSLFLSLSRAHTHSLSLSLSSTQLINLKCGCNCLSNKNKAMIANSEILQEMKTTSKLSFSQKNNFNVCFHCNIPLNIFDKIINI